MAGEMYRCFRAATPSALSFPGLKAEACRAPGQRFLIQSAVPMKLSFSRSRSACGTPTSPMA